MPIECEIPENLRAIQTRIEAACGRVARDPETVLLVGAAKTVEAATVRKYLQGGLRAVGENYVQEGVEKIEILGRESAQWHCIGALQSNKAREVVRHFDWVHSLDRPKLARALQREAETAGRELNVLLQVNVGGEISKAGCAPDELFALYESCCDLKKLNVRGLMCLPPPRENPADKRADFQQLRALRDDLQRQFAAASTCSELSMGMSGDFEIAIEEGATMIRIGTALFGKRANKE